MRYHALAADYDGTLAHHGVIDDETWAALRKFRESGRKLIMVTGRELDELLGLLGTNVEVFDRIVAENGGLIYEPATREVRLLCEPPPGTFGDELRRRGAERVACGRVIVATWEPHETTALELIRELGIELQVIFNKGAVMILPTGINKATGLAAALDELALSRHNVVGIGDAENDHALLTSCECGVAVANALDVLKEKADLVTKGDHGRGVIELIEMLGEDDLRAFSPKLARRQLCLGKDDEGGEVTFDAYASNILVCGTSGSGKSTFTTALLERLAAQSYQFAIIDPEGDFESFESAVVLGGAKREPLQNEILDVLKDPHDNVVVNLLGVALDHRPEFFLKLQPVLAEMRVSTGRPHWMIVDEAHHLMPANWAPGENFQFRPHGSIYLTVHPGSVSPRVLETIDTLVVFGQDPDEAVKDFCEARGVGKPKATKVAKLETGTAVCWKVGDKHVHIIKTEKPKTERTRHSRKYIEGNLGQSRSFYFRGRDGKLNLKAHNLLLFVQMAEGVDDDTWLFHLHNGDIANWMRLEVKAGELAEEVASIAEGPHDAIGSRVAVRAAIEKRYTLPADKPSGVIDTPPAFQQAR